MSIMNVRRWKVGGGVFALLVVAGVIFKVSVAARPVRSPATSADLQALNMLRTQLRSMGSLHVRASVEVTVEKAEGTVNGVGHFEYWEAGDSYRLESSLDPALGLGGATSIAFDGARFAYYDHTQHILSYSRADTRNNPASLPNPIFLMLDFLDQGTQDGCGNCRLRLADLDDNARWNEAMQAFTSGPIDTVASTRYSSVDGYQISHKVILSPDRTRIVGIEREDEKSGGRVRIDFGNHDARGLPRDLNIVVEAAAGTLHAWFPIDAVEAVASPDPQLFSLADDEAVTIWDSDTDTFLKTPGWDRPVSMAELAEICMARRDSSGGSASQ